MLYFYHPNPASFLGDLQWLLRIHKEPVYFLGCTSSSVSLLAQTTSAYQNCSNLDQNYYRNWDVTTVACGLQQKWREDEEDFACPGDGSFWWLKRASSWQQYIIFRYWPLQFWRPNNDVSSCNAGLELLQRSESASYNPKDSLKPKDYRIYIALSKRFVLQLKHGVCFAWKLLVFFLLAC